MVVKYSKTFVTTNPISHEPTTVLVEYIEAKDFRGVSIETFEGVHNPTVKRDPNKIGNFIPIGLSGARQLVAALTGALQAAHES